MAQGAQILIPRFDTGTKRLFVGDGSDYVDVLDLNQVDGLIGYKTDSTLGKISKVVVLTQAQYDALVSNGAVDAETEYNVVAG